MILVIEAIIGPMTKSEAVRRLEEIDRILNDVTRLDTLTALQRTQLKASASREQRDIDDIIRLLKRLDREAKKKFSAVRASPLPCLAADLRAYTIRDLLGRGSFLDAEG